MKALQSAAPSHMKYSIKESQSVNETKFYAFWGNKKHDIEGKYLWDAKQKAIAMLKVPKSKVGYLAVVNAKEHDGGSFMYELVNEFELEEGNEFGAERARAIAAGKDSFTVDGKTYKVTDVDPADKKNAE